jgi:hypothetical protein
LLAVCCARLAEYVSPARVIKTVGLWTARPTLKSAVGLAGVSTEFAETGIARELAFVTNDPGAWIGI